MIFRVLSILALWWRFCSFTWMYRYAEYLQSIFPKIQKIHKRIGKKMKFAVGHQEPRESPRAIILSIWAEGVSQFRPVRVRLIGGDAELLLGI